MLRMLSALLGIGGGIMKVPAMDRVMKIPFKVSTTTSNFMIALPPQPVQVVISGEDASIRTGHACDVGYITGLNFLAPSTA